MSVEEAAAGVQDLNIQDSAPDEDAKPAVILVIGERRRQRDIGMSCWKSLHCRRRAYSSSRHRACKWHAGSAPAAGHLLGAHRRRCRRRRLPPSCPTAGMAGSGKTTFLQRLNAHLHTRAEPGYIINLDPAVTHVPYGANVDIRDTVNYKNVSSARGARGSGRKHTTSCCPVLARGRCHSSRSRA